MNRFGSTLAAATLAMGIAGNADASSNCKSGKGNPVDPLGLAYLCAESKESTPTKFMLDIPFGRATIAGQSSGKMGNMSAIPVIDGTVKKAQEIVTAQIEENGGTPLTGARKPKTQINLKIGAFASPEPNLHGNAKNRTDMSVRNALFIPTAENAETAQLRCEAARAEIQAKLRQQYDVNPKIDCKGSVNVLDINKWSPRLTRASLEIEKAYPEITSHNADSIAGLIAKMANQNSDIDIKSLSKETQDTIRELGAEFAKMRVANVNGSIVTTVEYGELSFDWGRIAGLLGGGLGATGLIYLIVMMVRKSRKPRLKYYP